MSTIRLRRGTAAQWGTANPVLAAGEPGYETDTGLLKIGDGTHTWTTLPYEDPTSNAVVAAYVTATGATRTALLNLLLAKPTVVPLGNIAGTVTLDLSTGVVFTGTITGDLVVQYTNWPSYYVEPVLLATQDGSGGHAISVPGVTWQPNGTAPTWATAAGAISVITVASGDTGSHVYGQSGPLPHAATHGSGGTDPITVAQSQVTGLPAALTALAGAGTPIVRATASSLATTYATTALAAGTIAFETDTRLWKLGDGSTFWPTLSYVGGHKTDVFTASGTWTKLPGAKRVRVLAISGGCGGASGASGVSGTAQNGGGGGSGGSVMDVALAPADITDTVAVTVGGGGAGGAAVTAGAGTSVAGNAGTGGGNTTFGGYVAAMTGPGPSAPGTGSTTSTTSFAYGGTDGTKTVGAPSSANGAAGGSWNSSPNCGGGGSGGGVTTAPAPTNGGAAQASYRNLLGTAAAAGVAGAGGAAAAAGVASTMGKGAGNGGAGGGSRIEGAGWAGGAGGLYGGGGGGGGASLATFASGKGGDGAGGLLIVTQEF